MLSIKPKPHSTDISSTQFLNLTIFALHTRQLKYKYHGDEPKSERCAVMKIENMQLNLKSD